MKIPELNPQFSYGKIVNYKLKNITKDRNVYCVRMVLSYQSGAEVNYQKGGFKTKEEAKKGYEYIVHCILSETFVPFRFSLKEMAEYWLYHVCLKKLAYNTIMSYRNIVYRYLLVKIDKKLDKITAEELEKFLLHIESDSVRKTACKVVQGIFAYAYKNHYIELDIGAIAVKNAKAKKPGSFKKRELVWSLEQSQYALLVSKEKFPNLYMPLLLSLTLGTRISETIALKYSDFIGGSVLIQRQLGKEIAADGKEIQKEQKTKTINGIRELPVPDFVMQEIIVSRKRYERYRDTIEDFQDTNYVCCKINGEPYHRQSLNKEFKELLEFCRYDKNFHWHDLRHTYATVLSKLNMKAVSLFLGHSSEEFSKMVYIKESEKINDCSEIMERVYQEYIEKEEENVYNISEVLHSVEMC